MLHPLSYFSNSDISYIISSYHLSLSDSYSYRSRNGCIGCPMSSTQFNDLYYIFPKYKKIWLNAANLVCQVNSNIKFKSGADLFEWWLSQLSIRDYFELKKQKKINFFS